jgi:hypothetical protein
MDEEILKEELKGKGMLDNEEKPTCILNRNEKDVYRIIWSVADTLKHRRWRKSFRVFSVCLQMCVERTDYPTRL